MKSKLKHYRRDRRIAIRKRVADLKESQPCMDCGFFYPSCVMEYDHRPGADKVATVSDMVVNASKWSKIEAEMDKCDLVCANCHRYRTHCTRKEVLNPTQKAPWRASV